MKQNVLFICIHNSARSQKAEAFLNQICGNFFHAYSAGLEPGSLNPIVVEAMHEIGIDISLNQTKSVSFMLTSGRTFAYAIKVCDETSAERCPIFLANVATRWFICLSSPPSARNSPLPVANLSRQLFVYLSLSFGRPYVVLPFQDREHARDQVLATTDMNTRSGTGPGACDCADARIAQ